MEEDIEIGEKTTLKDYNNWVKKNWITMVAVIIIMVAVYVDTATVYKQKVDLLNDCNTHWRKEISLRYPKVGVDSTWMDVDFEGNLNETAKS